MSSPLGHRNALTFSHMGFYVRDIQRMARFYRDVLGFFRPTMAIWVQLN